MKTLQFHADPTEFSELLPAWLTDLDVVVAAEHRDRGDQAQIVSLNALKTLDWVGGNIHTVNIFLDDDTTRIMDLDWSDQSWRYDVSCIVLDVGRLTSSELRESAIGTISDSDEYRRVFRKVRARATKGMLRGGVAVNPWNGAKQEAKNHYYTPGAERLAGRGVKLLAVAGVVYYELPL
jgi:hypothetical protein